MNHGRELVPLTINVLAGGAPAGTLSATSLAFPRVKVGATTALTARLQNGGNAVLKVTGITRCDDASAAPFTWSPAAPLSIAPGGEATLSITYQPTVAASSTSCLRLGTNDPANPSIQLGVTGAADPAPAGVPGVALSGSSLSFGTGVLAGTYVKKTFDVQSSGAANLDVSGLAPCAGTAAGMFGFSSPLPGTIAPGEARTVTVSYTPTAAGSHAGCLTVTTSAGAIDVQLTGSAIMPAVTCTSCHGGKENASGAPPSDTSGESAVTRRGVGAHSAHLNTQLSPSTARQAADCTACHQAVPSFTSPLHRDGSTDVPFGGVAKAGGAAPSWNPQAPSCGTVYCHGATMPGGTNTAPGWTHVGAGEAACGKCHGVPPDESTGHPAVTGGLTACVSCHPKVMTAAGTVDPAGKHIDGVVDVATCTTCHGSGTQAAPPKDTKGNTATTALGVGAHLQHVNANAVAGAIACGECHGAAVGSCATPGTNGVVDVSFGALANQGTATTWDRTAATCAASYCHGGSGALTGGSATKPVWTRVDGTQASCGSCHGFPPPAPHAQNTSCDTCHPATVKPGGAIDVAGGKHLDGVVEVDSSTMTCSSCHGTPGRSGSDPFIAAAPPTGTNGETATTTRAVGAHLAHLQPGTLSKAYACTDCHNPPTAMDHANGVVEMSFSALAKGTGAPVFNGTTCASTYCHGNFTNGNTANAPSWTGGAAQVGCTSCHGSPPAGTHPANAACGNCHAGYTATTVDPAVHVNGLVEVSQSCTSCHGTSGVNAAPPKDTKGQTATTLVSVGAHQAHATTTLRAAIDCAECHGAAAASYTNTHPDNTVQVTFGALSNSQGGATAWNRTAATCASNYCHGGVAALKGGTATTPVWTRVDGTQKTCGSCHGNPPPASSGHVQRADCGSCHPGYTSSTVNLATHLDGTVEYPAQTCTSCHGSASLVAVAGADANVKAAPPVDTKANTAVTAAGVGVHQAHVNGARSKPVACAECHAGAVPPSTQPIHANGATTVAFGSVSRTGGAAPTYSTTALTCASTFCHGNFTGGAGAAATPAWTAAGALGCTSCHGDPPALPHPQDAACADCHGAGYSTTTVVASTHVDGVVNLTGVHPPGSCTACHGDATRTAVAGADANASSAPP
ncbi:MAG: CxxxxCH/CxxCH domain c-type cytochrome, partial [Anaeromyxobacteraceae bacterium]